MSDKMSWKIFENTFLLFANDTSMSLVAYDKERKESDVNTSTSNTENYCNNPIELLPYEVRNSLTSEFYEPAMPSILERYILNDLIKNKKNLQELMIGLFKYATRKNSHVVAWNTIVVLSELSYAELGDWADTLALAATRSQYMDVVEMGIRCFENWENIDACDFLKNCRFEEKWLQEYADQVYEYVKKEGWQKDVLSSKDYSWEMAEGIRIGSKYETNGYPSRYGTIGVQNG